MLNRLPPHTPLHSDLQDLKDTLLSAERQDAERLVKKEMTISELQNSMLTLHGERICWQRRRTPFLGFNMRLSSWSLREKHSLTKRLSKSQKTSQSNQITIDGFVGL
jgi:hypothetical protein